MVTTHQEKGNKTLCGLSWTYTSGENKGDFKNWMNVGSIESWNDVDCKDCLRIYEKKRSK